MIDILGEALTADIHKFLNEIPAEFLRKKGLSLDNRVHLRYAQLRQFEVTLERWLDYLTFASQLALQHEVDVSISGQGSVHLFIYISLK